MVNAAESQLVSDISVVLVDDHTIVLDGLRAVLENAGGIQVCGVAQDGVAALELMRACKPDIAVVDLALPKLSGIDLIEAAVAEEMHCRSIVLSMHSTAEHVAHALRGGAHGYVLKESAGSELITAIQRVAAGHMYLSARLERLRPRIDALVTSGKSALEMLSARERQILRRIIDGATSSSMADELGLSTKTVDTYRSRLMAKLGVNDLAGLIWYAVNHGIVPLKGGG
jgi:DNA-binding NarL/FixJ family response regulator